MPIDVVALGELLIDFALQNAENNSQTFIANPGGAPANLLACLSKMGLRTAFIGKVGKDGFGELLCQSLADCQIATEGLILDPDYFTTLAFVHLDDHGERSFSFARKPGADTMLTPDEINENLIASATFFHFGSLSLSADPCRLATQKALTLAKQHACLISFDPNLRPPLWSDLTLAKEEILWGLAQCNWLKISLEECAFLWPHLGTWNTEGNKDTNESNDSQDFTIHKDSSSLPELALENAYLAEIFKHENIDLVLLTKGEKGARIATRAQQISLPAPLVQPVDTTGAGDICGGAALSQFLSLRSVGKQKGKLNRSSIQKLGQDEILSILAFAVTAGSLSTEKLGAIPSIPEKNEILATIKNAY